jgi:hypothetical protein
VGAWATDGGGCLCGRRRRALCLPPHPRPAADPGWGIAGWFIPSLYAAYYDDDSFETAYYPHLRAYMEHWIKVS